MVVDTSIFIEYLRAKDKKKSALFAIPDSTQLFISSVTMYELLMGVTDENKQKDIKLLTEDLPVLPFDESVSKKAAEIYHQLCLENNMIDFREIYSLLQLAWHQIACFITLAILSVSRYGIRD